jgi:iodotyrosine deiodinase
VSPRNAATFKIRFAQRFASSTLSSMTCPETVPLDFMRLEPSVMEVRAGEFAAEMARRRTVRDFSSEPVERSIIEACVRCAGSAPSGANQQPWHFAIVGDAALKRQIREEAEEEEREFYSNRAPKEWLDALAPLGTRPEKPFLEKAPWLIAIFAAQQAERGDGGHQRIYYPKESVGIASGFLIAALHHAGLATLTHTPSPMRFLNAILGRPAHEKPFLLLVVGYPADGARVPAITRKSFAEIATFH